MAKTIGIICEYNPFHSGHKYHINEAKKHGDRAVCAMSGSFTQRGEATIFDKLSRAKCAVLGGADLVVELPFFAAVSSANYFADYGVRLLGEMCDTVAFGSESGDLKLLSERMEEDSELIKKRLGEGESYAVAAAVSSEIAPNDILGVEYLRAIKKFNRKNKKKLEALSIKRQGEGYNSEAATGDFISASACRKLILNGDFTTVLKYIPDECHAVFSECIENKNYVAKLNVLPTILRYNKEALKDNPYIKEGIENRFYAAAEKLADTEEILKYVKTKRYLYTTISRIAATASVGLKKQDFLKFIGGEIEYIRILAANKTGMKIVSDLKKSGKCVIINYKDTKNLSDIGKEMINLEQKATAIRNLGVENKLIQKNDFENKFEII